MRTEPNESEKRSFERAVEMIDRENGIKEYSNWCGPRVLAAVKGISPIAAAEILWNIQKPKVRGITNMFALAEALGKKIESAAIEKESTQENRSIHTKFSDRFPSLSKWLDENKTRFGIVRVGHSFLYVGFGQVILSTGFDGQSGRVTHVIWLD